MFKEQTEHLAKTLKGKIKAEKDKSKRDLEMQKSEWLKEKSVLKQSLEASSVMGKSQDTMKDINIINEVEKLKQDLEDARDDNLTFMRHLGAIIQQPNLADPGKLLVAVTEYVQKYQEEMRGM